MLYRLAQKFICVFFLRHFQHQFYIHILTFLSQCEWNGYGLNLRFNESDIFTCIQWSCGSHSMPHYLSRTMANNLTWKNIIVKDVNVKYMPKSKWNRNWQKKSKNMQSNILRIPRKQVVKEEKAIRMWISFYTYIKDFKFTARFSPFT